MIDIDALMGPVPTAPGGAAVSADDQGDFAAALALASGNGQAPDGRGGATASVDPGTGAAPGDPASDEMPDVDAAIESEAALLALVGPLAETPPPTDPAMPAIARPGSPAVDVATATEPADGESAAAVAMPIDPTTQPLMSPDGNDPTAPTVDESTPVIADESVAAPRAAVGRPVAAPDRPIDGVTAGTTEIIGEAAPTAAAPNTPEDGTPTHAPTPAVFEGVADPEAAAPMTDSPSIELSTTPGADGATEATVDDGVALVPTPTVETATPADAGPRIAPVAGPAPVADAAVVAETAEIAGRTAPPEPEATPAQQVAEALREVRRLADGSHRLSLQLHPEELGAVQLEVAVRDGQLHVRAVAETEMARSTLEQNLPELRNELRDAGVRAGSLEVGPDASGRDDARSSDAEPGRTDRSRRDAAETTADSSDPNHEMSTDHGVDIRI